MSKRKKITQRDPLGYLLSTAEEEEDDTEDSTSIVADGQRVRVPMWAMDSVQKAVAQDTVNIDSGPMLVDALGRGDSYSLSKPGARYLATNPGSTDHAVMASRERLLTDAYQQYDQAMAGAWQSHDEGDHPLITKKRTVPAKQQGDACSIDGKRGRLQMVNGELQCISDKQDSAADAYEEYDTVAANAWRS
jgi:hypothetical protein